MRIKEDLEQISSLVKTMEEQLELLKSVNDSYITDTLEFDISCKDKIKKIKSEEDINNISERDLYDYFNAEDIEKTRDNYNPDDHDGSDFLTYMREVLSTIYKSNLDYIKMEKEKIKLIEDANKITDDYFSYINSTEYIEKRKAHLKKMREEVEAMEDSSKKKRSLKEIDAMESASNLEFLYDHINEVGKKELKNITDIFFNGSRSKCVIDKFKFRMKQYGYKDTTFQQFFNIEEKFLPEEYHPFNNLFLFNVMRFISFTNPYDKIDSVQASAALLKMYNLINHRLPDDQKTEFIEFIKKFLDQFVDFKETYTNKNATAPGHPERIEADKKYDEKLRMMLISSIQNLGVEPDTSLETEELRKQLDELLKGSKEDESADEESSEEPLETIVIDESNDDLIPEEEVAEGFKYLGELSSLDDVSEPEEGNVCVINGTRFIFNNGSWEAMDNVDTIPDLQRITYLGVFNSIEEFPEGKEGYFATLRTMDGDDYKDYLYVYTDPESKFVKVELGEDSVEGSFEAAITDESSMIVNVEKESVPNETVTFEAEVIESNEETKKEYTDCFIDPYKCIYAKDDDGTYSYYEKDFKTLIEDNIDEDDILRLLSSGSIKKVDPSELKQNA